MILSLRKAARLLLLLPLLLPVGCRRQVVENRPTIPLVREILADKSDPRAQMLRGKAAVPAADITLIGGEFACDRLAERFATRDLQDNVDARMIPDGLPDFAGETFSCLEDTTPYLDYVLGGREEELRRQTVLRVLSALDTVVHISPYDLEGLSSKSSSKVIILADPFLNEFGGFDADTLLRAAGCSVSLVLPVEQMLDRAFSQSGGLRDLSVGILCDPQFDSTGIYERIFARKAAEYGAHAASCTVYGVEQRDSVLHNFLRYYIAGGGDRPLDVILVDDLSVDMESLKFELAETVSVMNESSMTYGRLISRNFFFVEAFEEMAGNCYQFLRERNLFTHNIAMPQVSVFYPVRKPDSTDDSIILIPSSYVQN